MELPLAHYLQMTRSDGSILKFQNFFIGQTSDGYGFLPFGFSGISVSRQGGNIDTTLVFPNRDVARSYADEAISDAWLCKVKTCIVQDPSDPNTSLITLFEYVGKVSAGGWDETAVKMLLNSILDSVGSDLPQRTLHQRLVGNLPFTANVAL